jgi:hypothetical protein
MATENKKQLPAHLPPVIGLGAHNRNPAIPLADPQTHAQLRPQPLPAALAPPCDASPLKLAYCPHPPA